MVRLLALWQKEFIALLRDRHGLAALFVMPAIFILIMSLALRDALAPAVGGQLGYAVLNLDRGPQARSLTERLQHSGSFKDQGSEADLSTAREAVRRGRHAFVLIIEPGFGQSIASPGVDSTPRLRLLMDPTVPPDLQVAFRNQVLAALGSLRANEFVRRASRAYGITKPPDIGAQDWQRQIATAGVGAKGTGAMPSAVQQSVPSWLIFSMFFVVIPMSAMFITERLHGTLQRLQTQQVPFHLILAGKLLPFFVVNQVQALLMVLVGRYLVPLLGGEALTLPDGIPALGTLWLVAATVSLAAIAWGLFVASLARSSEQATVIGGVGNILMGAVGGIMVPKFVMPAFMQKLTAVSPMAWGLDGFYAVMLRNGGMAEVLPYVGALLGFALTALATALWINARARRSAT